MASIWQGEPIGWKVVFDFEGTGVAGDYLSVVPVAAKEGTPALHIGLGKEEDLTLTVVKCAAAKAVHVLRAQKTEAALVLLDSILASALGTAGADAAVEGLLLAQYTPQSWKTDPKKQNVQLYLGVAPQDQASLAARLKGLHILTNATLYARDLVNAPANLITPETMATEMAKSAEASGLDVQVLDETEIEALGMQALLTVGRSALHPPRLIVLRYNGAPESDQKIALVGKGVTCDTGGYCLKPPSSMGGIRGDMAGAAAVFGSILALAQTKVPVNAVAVIPSAENRISPDSYLPGDIIGSMAGKSIEVGNTDAEGRLMLADALTYAVRKENATHILDIATLTGAVVNMFGFTTAGLLCNNDDFYAQFAQAASLSAEQYWRLPIFPEYKKMIETPVADLQNISSDGCGTITAGLFIGSFNEGLPWIHLDIAGTAWVEPPRWEFQAKGATGAGVTTLYRLCCLMAQS